MFEIKRNTMEQRTTNYIPTTVPAYIYEYLDRIDEIKSEIYKHRQLIYAEKLPYIEFKKLYEALLYKDDHRGDYMNGFLVARGHPVVLPTNLMGEIDSSYSYCLFKRFDIFKKHYYELDQKDRHFYEIIRYDIDKPKDIKLENARVLEYDRWMGRLFFDIDADEKLYKNDFLHPTVLHDFEECVKATLTRCYPNAIIPELEFVWSTCNRNDKASYHLVVKGIYFDNFRLHMLDLYKEILKTIYESAAFYYIPKESLCRVFDRVYSHVQFKMVDSSKVNGKTMKFMNPKHTLEDSLIRPCFVLRLDAYKEDLYLKHSELKRSEQDLDKRIFQDVEYDVPIEQILDQAYKYCVKNLNWFASTFTEGNISGNCLWLRRMQSLYCDKCKRTHNKRPAYITVRGDDMNIHYNCCGSPGEKVIGTIKELNDDGDVVAKKVSPIEFKPKEYETPRQWRMLKDEYSADIIKDLDPNKSVEVVRSKMDSRKTMKTIQYIKDHSLTRVVWLSSRRKYAYELYGKLTKEFKNVVLYETVTDWKEISLDSIIIVQMESLYKVPLTSPQLLVMDECTSCYKQFLSSTMKECGRNKAMLDVLIKHSQKVVCLDGDVDDRTFIPLLELRTDSIYIQWNVKPRDPLEAYKFKDESMLIKYLLKLLVDGKNLYVVCSTKEKAEMLYAMVRKHGIRSKCYTGANKDDKDLMSVNSAWVKYQCVIITSTITTGVDFHADHFDCMFVFGQNGKTCCVRDLKQMMGRVRKLRDNTILYHLVVKKYHRPVRLVTITARYLDRLIGIDGYEKELNYIRNRILVQYNINGEVKLVIDDDWLTKIQMLNIQENNLTDNYFDELFTYTLNQLNCVIRPYDKMLGKKDEMKKYIKETRKEIQEEKKEKYENTKKITPDKAQKIVQDQKKGEITTEAAAELDRYTVEKHFQDDKTPSYEEYKVFKSNKHHIINAKLETEFSNEDVHSRDIYRLKNPYILSDVRFDQHQSIKDLCKLLGFESTIKEGNKYSTMDIKKNEEEFKTVCVKACHAFDLAVGTMQRVQDIAGIINKCFEKWSGVYVTRQAKKTPVSEGRKDYTEFTFKVPSHQELQGNLKPLILPNISPVVMPSLLLLGAAAVPMNDEINRRMLW